MIDTGLSIDWEKTKVLDRESNWFRRGVKEAINIRRKKPDLNLDQGRHHLPPCFDKLVSHNMQSSVHIDVMQTDSYNCQQHS